MTANLLDMEGFDSLSPLSENTVALTESSLQWVTDGASSIPDTSLDVLESTDLESAAQRRWQHFLERMAIAGFRQWLTEGATDLTAKPIQPSARSSANLQVGSYRLYIAPINRLSSSTLEIPIKLSTDAENNTLESALAHLYVLTEVQEEIDQVQIVAGLWKEQLNQALGQTIDLISNSAPTQRPQTLSVPLSAFTVEPEQILLCLNCLEPSPVTASNTVSASAQSIAQSAVESTLTSIINARNWLQGQVDTAVEQINWALLPPISPAMRPVKEPVDAALEALSLQGVQLPLQARGVGGPISLGSHICQVYTWAWPIESAEAEDSEWALFVLLGPSVGEMLPQGIQLQVCESGEVLTQETLMEASSEAYLFTQVQGAQTERFVVSVMLPDGLEITLPAFSFES